MKIRGQRVIPPEERIKSGSTIDHDTGCWLWQGQVRSKDRPYGRLTVGSRSDGTRRSYGAHQLSYETFKGPIPKGMLVCHTCDNPRCVNPDHLFIGTYKDNADDRDSKGRGVPAPRYYGASAPSAKLNDAQVQEIRSSPLSSRKLAPQYGISDSQLRAIRRGLYYPEPPTNALRQGRKEGE